MPIFKYTILQYRYDDLIKQLTPEMSYLKFVDFTSGKGQPSNLVVRYRRALLFDA